MDIGNASERNKSKTFDNNTIRLPTPLYQKSQTMREGGRNSAKVRGAPSHGVGGQKMKKNQSKANSNNASRNFSASQISQQNRTNMNA